MKDEYEYKGVNFSFKSPGYNSTNTEFFNDLITEFLNTYRIRQDKIIEYLNKEIKFSNEQSNYKNTEFQKECAIYFEGRWKLANELKDLILKDKFY